MDVSPSGGRKTFGDRGEVGREQNWAEGGTWEGLVKELLGMVEDAAAAEFYTPSG